MENAEVKQALDTVKAAFEEFKRERNTQIDEIKKGVNDPLREAKIAKIEADLAKYEGVNQKITVAAEEAKAAKAYAEELEAKFNRAQFGAAGIEKPEEKETRERKAAFVGYLRKGVERMTADEQKSLVASNDTAGGYLQTPEMIQEIIKAEVLVSPVRSIVNVRTTGAGSTWQPKRTSVSSASWVAEIQTRAESTNPGYGLIEIPVHEMTAEHYVSMRMLEDSFVNIEGEINQEFGEQFAVLEGAAVVSGNGVGKPLGFLDAGAGVSSVNSGTATTIADASGQANGVVALFHAIKTAYAQNGVWAFNRKTLGSIRKLQDTTKRYLWEPSLVAGAPSTILGNRYVELPDMPDEGAGTFPIAFGDFRRAYTMVDRLAVAVVRDPYTKASAGQVKFVARKRVGGQVVLAEALLLLKCST